MASSVSARVVTGKIVDLVSWLDGHSVIKIENGPVNGCAGQYYYSLGVRGQDVKAEPMLSIALAAYMADKSVQLSTSDGVCQGGEEKITNIRVLKAS
jgi:hypothetical protein